MGEQKSLLSDAQSRMADISIALMWTTMSGDNFNNLCGSIRQLFRSVWTMAV